MPLPSWVRLRVFSMRWEAIEQARHLLWRNPDSRIADSQLDRVAGAREVNGDFAFERELESIGDQIEDNLFPHPPFDKNWFLDLRTIQFNRRPVFSVAERNTLASSMVKAARSVRW